MLYNPIVDTVIVQPRAGCIRQLQRLLNVIGCATITGTNLALLCVRDMLYDRFSIRVINAFKYKDDVVVVASHPSCTVERLR